MRFHKYHALGNDYLVLDPADYPGIAAPSSDQVRRVCHRHFGVGSDGILWGPVPSSRAHFGLRIFNPDGSEAEKSGNGLRIFARDLFDQGKATTAPFTIDVPGGVVEVVIAPGGDPITVAMGRVSFGSDAIPVAGPKREVLDETIRALDRDFAYSAATIGNPHCVIILPEVSADLARRYGPALETHPNFPRRTNVQFVRVLDRTSLQIEIWERGAGYTLASGSSSCAAAAVAHRLGHVADKVAVHMPGGRIDIALAPDFSLRMTGPVTPVASGFLQSTLLAGAS
ncbi:MAG: diaminopimelate epimerase [Limisphaerales bacterium]